MQTTKTALIAGATGLVGHQCLHQLLADKRYEKVISIGRRPLAAEHPKLVQKIVDFDILETFAEELKADDVYCCLGTTIKKAGSQASFFKVDFTYVTKLAAIASAQGAQQFLVVSAMGADVNASIFYNKVKGQMQEALQQIPFKSIHIFQPSLLLGDRKESRPGEKAAQLIMPVFHFLMVGPLKKYRAIEDQTVAKAMIRAAHQEKPGVHIYPSDEIEEMGTA